MTVGRGKFRVIVAVMWKCGLTATEEVLGSHKKVLMSHIQELAVSRRVVWNPVYYCTALIRTIANTRIVSKLFLSTLG